MKKTYIIPQTACQPVQFSTLCASGNTRTIIVKPGSFNSEGKVG